MPKGEDITTRYKVDISDLKKGITEANKNIKLANAQFKAASAGMDDWQKSSNGLTAKLQQLKTVLTEENKKMFMIPKGFAHGFLVLSDEAEFAYKCDDIYNHEAEGGLAWNDPDVGINWPMGDLKVEELLTSEKDGKWPSLKELKETDLFSNLK